MAGTSRYTRAKELIQNLRIKYTSVSLDTLKRAIMMNLGGCEKATVIPYLKLMRETSLIKEIPSGWALAPFEDGN